MQHVKPIAAKFFIYTIIMTLVLVFYGFSILSILMLSAMLAIITYVLGDLIVLPFKGNFIATVADGAIIFLGALILMAPTYGLYFSTIAGALFLAFLLAVCEWFIHLYIIGRINERDREPIYD